MTALRLLGIGPARSLPAGSLALSNGLAAAIAPSVPDRDVAAVRAHHRAIVALCRRDRFLPAPLGVDFPSAAALREALARLEPGLPTDIEWLGERVEWSMRLDLKAEDPDPSLGPGRAFLAQSRAASAARAVLERLVAAWPVVPEGAEIASAARLDDSGRLRVSLLIARGTARERVEAVGRCLLAQAATGAQVAALPNHALTFVGPWPPYAFAALRSRLGLATEGPADDAA